MRPSDTPETVCTMDRTGELKVILDVVDNPRQYPLVAKLAAPDTIQRFRGQARDVMYVNSADPPYFNAVDVWANHPRFDVKEEDLPLVVAAAQTVLLEKNPVDVVFNFVSRRLRGARRIVSWLNDHDLLD